MVKKKKKENEENLKEKQFTPSKRKLIDEWQTA